MSIFFKFVFLVLHTQIVLSAVEHDVEKMCANYSKFEFGPLVELPEIVGGELAKKGEFPHMAAIGFGNGPNWQWKCGGSLISDRFILTAAQCTQKFGEIKVVRLGASNLETPGPYYKDCEVVTAIPHPAYSKLTGLYDIAILRIKMPITFSPYIKPACVNVIRNFDGSTLTATGWGSDAIGGRPQEDLYKVGLALYQTSRCTFSLLPGLEANLILCAGRRKYKPGDTCTGDDGGPLQILSHKHQYHIVGITTINTCAFLKTPTRYTRVSNFIDWIEETMRKYEVIFY